MPALDPNDLLLFARVADAGSFSRAGDRLGLPKSTISRRVAHLESQLGERLLQRTTRKLSLTDFGHSVLAHAQQVADETEAATLLAHHRQVEPSGRLRVSMPGDFANLVLSRLMADFIARYPQIDLEVDVSPRRVDLIGENYDLAIRMGDLADDASLAARRLASFSGGLCAAPAYLARRGMPADPQDLHAHDLLQITIRHADPRAWRLVHETTGAHWEGPLDNRVRANAPELLIRLACAGSGIATVADHFVVPYLQSGELVPVLPDWRLAPVPCWAVFPGRRLMPARTRVFLDALEAEFDAPACQVAVAKQDAVRRAARVDGSA